MRTSMLLIPRWSVAAAIAAVALWSVVGASGLSAVQDDVAEAIAAARSGGTTIVCRHAITGSFREVEPIDYADHASQRRLSDEGRRQSREMGRALRALGVEVSELVASPMHRSLETAELMFAQPVTIDSIWHTNDGDYDGADRERRARVLATSVATGNRLVVSHIGTMSSVLPQARSRADEGDCVVVRPSAEGFEIIGIVPWRAWIQAAEGGSLSAGALGGRTRRDRGDRRDRAGGSGQSIGVEIGGAGQSPVASSIGSTRAASDSRSTRRSSAAESSSLSGSRSTRPPSPASGSCQAVSRIPTQGRSPPPAFSSRTPPTSSQHIADSRSWWARSQPVTEVPLRSVRRTGAPVPVGSPPVVSETRVDEVHERAAPLCASA